jgi:hypothetical protein
MTNLYKYSRISISGRKFSSGVGEIRSLEIRKTLSSVSTRQNKNDFKNLLLEEKNMRNMAKDTSRDISNSAYLAFAIASRKSHVNFSLNGPQLYEPSIAGFATALLIFEMLFSQSYSDENMNS